MSPVDPLVSVEFSNEATKSISPEQEYLLLMQEKERRLSFKKFETYEPYEKQALWLGFKCKCKALFGANRVGKTMSAAFELVCHLTGKYPDWWKGKRFFRPIQARCVAVSFEQLRKVMQAELMGDIRFAMGTGMIPKDLIVDHTMHPGMTDVVSTVWVKHITGGVSVCEMMANTQGREAMQGDAKQVIWIDEECDWDVFVENKMRTAGTGDKAAGIMLITFTPLKGRTELVKWLFDEMDHEVVQKVIIGWADVPHLTEQDKKDLVAGLLPHEVEARTTGMPTMASGMIYPVDQKYLLINPFELERYDVGILGWDVATTGTTAGMLLMRDVNADITYGVRELVLPGTLVPNACAAIRSRVGRFPVRIDPSSKRSDRDHGTIIKEYREGLGENWEIKFAYNNVQDGIRKLYTAMMQGKFFVFKNCRHWVEEWQDYIWDEKKVDSAGNPVPRKKNDHLMDATRYAFWDIDKARPKDYREREVRSTAPPILDPYTGY